MRSFKSLFYSLPILMLSTLSLAQVAETKTVRAQDRQRILACLGQEELRLHKIKHSKEFFAPYYRINSLLVNEISSLGDLKLKASYADRVCESGQPVGEGLLRELLLAKEDIFEPNDELSKEHRPYELGAIRELNQRAPQIMFQYLSDLQSQAPSPSCLFKHIPHFQYFLDRFHYLEEDLDNKQLLSEKTKLAELFKGLVKLQAHYQQCAKEEIAAQKAAAKKAAEKAAREAKEAEAAQ